MSAATNESGRPARLNRRLAAWLLVGGGVALFAAANAHLVHVAVTSQPDCVEHLKTEGKDGAYRAARPSC